MPGDHPTVKKYSEHLALRCHLKQPPTISGPGLRHDLWSIQKTEEAAQAGGVFSTLILLSLSDQMPKEGKAVSFPDGSP